MAEKQRFDVFLSYAHQDKAWVSEFAAALREAGVTAWFDVQDLLPGERRQEQIQAALRESSTLVVIVSPHNVQSHWVFFELGAAVADNKRIIPVLAEGMLPEALPVPLRQFQYLQEPSPSAAGRRVAEAIKSTSASNVQSGR